MNKKIMAIALVCFTASITSSSSEDKKEGKNMRLEVAEHSLGKVLQGIDENTLDIRTL